METLVLGCLALVTRSIAQTDDGGRMSFLQADPGAHFAERMLSLAGNTTYIGSTTTPAVMGVGLYQSEDGPDRMPSSTDNDFVKKLEDDGRVRVQRFQLGELLCESLANAEDAPALKFVMSPDETLMANKRSFTVYSGSIFADGITRKVRVIGSKQLAFVHIHSNNWKVWMGEVVHDRDEVSSQTASMTWGDVCDAETFLLKIPTKFVNGTFIVAKTIPCEEGGPFNICVVEMEIDFPDEGPGLSEHGGIVSGDARRLRHKQVKSKGEVELDVDIGDFTSTGRQLQSTTQIDLIFLYTPGGRDILGVSDSQMQSELADSLVTVNEAMVNSDVDLQFSLVRVEPLPYTEESNTSSVVLDNLEVNSDVAKLRDAYGADIVHLVADLGADDSDYGSCGLANTPVSPDDALAFGVVDPYCFFQFSHTHEIVHNMGCYHDRENSNTQHKYAHGYRYCDGDLPYRTIMTYACVDEDGFPLPVSRVNYLSNPDVTLNGRPTGTMEDNCARRVKETMGDVANYREASSASITPAPSTPITLEPTTDPATCSNGISGVERDSYCCALGCGTCGGSGCSQRAREAGLTSDDCCVTRIGESEVYCDDSGTAPCIVGEGLVEAGERTIVVVSASAYDERTSGYGCAPDGCVAANTRDSSLSTRWACNESLLGGANCEITFKFSEPQNLDVVRIAFYKGTERKRKLKVKIHGSTYSEIDSSGQTDDFEDFKLGTDDTSEFTLEGLELGSEDWIALTEVQFMVP